MAASRLFVDPKPASKRSAETVGRNYLNGKEGSPALPQDIYFRTPQLNIRALLIFIRNPTNFGSNARASKTAILKRPRGHNPTEGTTPGPGGLCGQSPLFPGHGPEWPSQNRLLNANGHFWARGPLRPEPAISRHAFAARIRNFPA